MIMDPAITMTIDYTKIRVSRKSLWTLSLLAGGGMAAVVLGLFVEPQRTLASSLLTAYYVLGIGMGGALFISLVSVSNAGWATAFRRVPEALTANIYAGGILMILLLPAVHELYEWSHADVVAVDPILRSKSGWLNVPFFSVRTVLYVTLWSFLAALLVRTSRLQDRTGAVELTARNRRYAGFFIVAFMLTFWMASMDWLMSLEPHWYSTIYGIYNMTGTFLSGLAAVTVGVISLRRKGYLRFVRDNHLLDLGRLIFAFSTFWMYIWFSQYLLIWYANIPEETTYFLRRETAGWGTFAILNILFNWLIPFTVLMSKSSKRNEAVLFKVCLVLLVGHWIDLFWMILPPFMPEAPVISLWELAPVATGTALVILVTLRSLSQASLIPFNDPMLNESLRYHD
ncbi:MAG: hypothetical protein WEB37_08395 [Bacteroidota bacterium]